MCNRKADGVLVPLTEMEMRRIMRAVSALENQFAEERRYGKAKRYARLYDKMNFAVEQLKDAQLEDEMTDGDAREILKQAIRTLN